jgi:3-hydroxyacyl-CoA dehydrogenase/enoyl-CoA hydratase/3-hydroxybutyryl-CoA epimerase
MRSELAVYRNWQLDQRSDGIVWIRADQAGRNVNTLSQEVLDEFALILDDLSRLQPAGAVVCSGKPGTFIAGADVRELSAVVDSQEALTLVKRVHAIFDRLEQLPFPTVSLVHGSCLGGGLELALACNKRIAVDDPLTVFGMPEVNLGIHPGFGGTVRLVNRIGPIRAMDLMLSGRSITARQALKIGLVDDVVPEQLTEVSVGKAILQAAGRRTRGLFDLFLNMRFSRRLIAGFLRRSVGKRVNKEHYPAPYALLDLWERFGGDSASAYREESRSVARLVAGATAQNLIRVFLLQERMKALGKHSDTAIRTVHVVGAGTMGGDIAAWCALQGLHVTIHDVEQQRLAAAVERASGLFTRRLRNPRLMKDARDRLMPDPSGDGIARADIVIEAIFENAKAKQELYRQLEPRMRRDALLATNTSSIPLEDLSGSLQDPTRFVGLHFFNPVAKMRLVEVVRGAGVDPGKLNCAMRFVTTLGRLPLPVASAPGFLVNRILMPYLLEAVTMEQDGIPASDIDVAARKFGMPMGPVLLADTIGLDICLSVMRILGGHFKTEVPPRLEQLVSMGRLGKKSGLGFYTYKNGKPVAAERKSGSWPDRELEDRLILRLLNEAIACWRERIVADRDLLDAGAVFGIGFAPFRGGPLQYIRTEGIKTLLARLTNLEVRYGNRFAANPGWHELAQEL